MDSSRRLVSFREIEDKDQAEKNPLRDMFASSSSHVIKSVELEYVESQPSTRWQLPVINASDVNSNLSPFHLISATRISIKETVIQIQENSECVQSIPLLNPKYLQAEA